ncbi:MAG: hypothetical protein K0S47_4092 [Herbinix sp.]|jgi:hypothetical protein|nr:hypothetical protein [Herbinix sp.]
MENITKLLVMIASMLMFCFGLLFFLSMYQQYIRSLHTEREQLKDSVIYQQFYSEEDIVTYSELIATLYMELDYDIQINDIMYKRNSFELNQMNESNIPNATYSKSYLYDSNGTILRVIYTSDE